MSSTEVWDIKIQVNLIFECHIGLLFSTSNQTLHYPLIEAIVAMSDPKPFELPGKFNLKILPVVDESHSKKVLLVFEDLKTLAAKSSPGSLTLKQFKKKLYLFLNPLVKPIHHTDLTQPTRRAILQ